MRWGRGSTRCKTVPRVRTSLDTKMFPRDKVRSVIQIVVNETTKKATNKTTNKTTN